MEGKTGHLPFKVLQRMSTQFSVVQETVLTDKVICEIPTETLKRLRCFRNGILAGKFGAIALKINDFITKNLFSPKGRPVFARDEVFLRIKAFDFFSGRITYLPISTS